jgi:hypothetical protein
MFEFLGNLFSNALAVTVLVILVTSLIGFCVKMRGRDRCLRDLDGFQVTIETKDDQVAWGTLRTYATPASRKSSPGRPGWGWTTCPRCPGSSGWCGCGGMRRCG